MGVKSGSGVWMRCVCNVIFMYVQCCWCVYSMVFMMCMYYVIFIYINYCWCVCMFSPTGKYIICGSEDHFLFVWKTNYEFVKFTSARRDRNDYWEAIKGTYNISQVQGVFCVIKHGIDIKRGYYRFFTIYSQCYEVFAISWDTCKPHGLKGWLSLSFWQTIYLLWVLFLKPWTNEGSNEKEIPR